MLDAILVAVRDVLHELPQEGYDQNNCDVMPDGKPSSGAGEFYVAIHQTETSSDSVNCLNERYSFLVTITLRVNVPLDRIGDQLLALRLARTRGPRGKKGMNQRAEVIKNNLHQCWPAVYLANNYLLQWADVGNAVYGFSEPPQYVGQSSPQLKGAEWFDAEESTQVGLVLDLRFDKCRRFQAIGSYA